MAYIFLSIWIIYSLVFFAFYKSGNAFFSTFSWSLIIEIILYLVVGLYLFFNFLNLDLSKKKLKKDEVKINKFSLDKKQIMWIFQNYSYYIAFVLFYISIFIFSNFFQIQVALVVFLINILILIFFFYSNKSNLSNDFLRINAHLFSFSYIVYFLFSFITWEPYLSTQIINVFSLFTVNLAVIWFLNNVLILVSFILNISYDKTKSWYDNLNIFYLFFYLFISIIFYFHFYILNHLNISSIFFTIWIFSIWFSYLIFDYFTKLKMFKNKILILKLFSIIFLYVWVLFSIIYLSFNEISYLVLISLLFSTFFNYYIHRKLENYISFIISIFSFFYIFYYIILSVFSLSINEISVFILSFFLSFIMIALVYKIKFKYLYDYYIFIFASYFINIIFSIIYLIYNFDILNIAIILFLDSIYFFASYYKMREVKNYFNN